MKRVVIFHPFVIALYPAITLYLQNHEYVPLNDTLVSFLLIFGLLAALWLGIARWIRNPDKAALIVSAFMLLFFSFGHILRAISNYSLVLFHVDEGRVRFLHTQSASVVLLVFVSALFVVIILLTRKSKFDFRLFTQFMNGVSVALLLFTGYRTVSIIIANEQTKQKLQTLTNEKLQLAEFTNLTRLHSDPLPDIYYIILDGYARSDTMKDIIGYDNSGFIESLRQKGFYVAEQSHSNYNFTYGSLTSSLNFDYLESLAGENTASDNIISLLLFWLSNNRAMYFLNTQGYTTIVFSSGYYPVEHIETDTLMQPVGWLNNFEDELLKATPLKLVINKNLYEMHRQRILYQFQFIPQVEDQASPRFVFAHILAPHQPYVFMADGSPYNADQDFRLNEGDDVAPQLERQVAIQGYHNQAIFISSQAEILVEKLLQLDPQPIIILQSDHGSSVYYSGSDVNETNIPERYGILNAYYFPGQDYSKLYASVTPVNTFRIIFNQYFGTQFDLLEDQSYWMRMSRPGEPINVTDRYNTP